MPRVPHPLDPQTLQELIGGPCVRREMLGDDPGEILSLLGGGAQRGCALAAELIGDGAPDQRDDDGHGRHQLDAELADGRRRHGR